MAPPTVLPMLALWLGGVCASRPGAQGNAKSDAGSDFPPSRDPVPSRVPETRRASLP